MQESGQMKAKDSRRGLRGRITRGSRGQSLIEFVLMMPILMIMIFGIIDFGMGLRSYISLTNATREGARFAAVGNPAGAYPTDCDGTTSTSSIGRVCVTMEGLGLSNLNSVSVSYPNGNAPGNSVIVAADYTYNFITPLGGLIRFFSGGTFPDTLSLNTSADMRLE